ncbi:hypothetical protein LQV05_004952 [Cryptococcus neoformans]|nr:hypothetical protein J007_03151 [Cryptococcus neoformans var. grubii]OXC61336.1 hypothetical protein C358_03237 [Cryptococcus neoformans var. grubii MW-RSA852]UOH82255.1 hypothetical protein LQV05_004952 [Cryptococcus neoformans]
MSPLTLAQLPSNQIRPSASPSRWASSPHRPASLPLSPSLCSSALPRTHPIPLPSSPLRPSLVPALPLPLASIAVPATASIPNMPLPPPLNQNHTTTHNQNLDEAPWCFSFMSRMGAPASAIVPIPPAPPNTLLAASTAHVETVPARMGGVSLGDWAPSSVKDLKSLARSLEGSTIKPVPISFIFENDNFAKDGEVELLKNHQGSFEFERRMKEIERELRKQPLSTATPSRGSQGSITIKAGPLLGRKARNNNGLTQGIDEVDVEWCFLCGKEGQRGGMELKSVDGEGWQWLCQSCS